MVTKPNHNADIKNSNPGTSGVNDTYKQNDDNRKNQLNPNHPEYKGGKKE